MDSAVGSIPQTSLMASFDVEAIRRDFPILHRPLPGDRKLIYLDNAASAQKPRQVIQKEVEVYENYYANAYRGDYHFGVRVDEELEHTRSTVQRLIGAKSSEEIIFTSGTTMAINLVAHSWGRKFLQPGDEILLTEMEHHANIVPWQMVAAQTGATLKYLPITSEYRLDCNSLDQFLNGNTRLVAVTAMSNVLGTINPLTELTKRAHEVGAKVLVDAAQSVPHQLVKVNDPPVDFLAFSGHKIYGPSGIGILYGRRELLEEMDPFLGGGHMIDRVGFESSTWAQPPAKFEAGTLPIAQAISLATALEYISVIGYESIRSHEHALLRDAHKKLEGIPGLTIHGPALEHKGAIVSFTLEGAHPQDVASMLDRKGVAVRFGHHCTMPLHEKLGVSATVRASFGIYNTTEEVDALVDAIHFARKRLRLA
ncbi:MAG: cysteine desulfurase [Planctomycetaceae bacterium]